MTTGMLVPLLVFAWAVFLVPTIMRRRAERGSGDSIADFRSSLARLHGRPTPHQIEPVKAPNRFEGISGPPIISVRVGSASQQFNDARIRRSRKRRREVFTGLVAAAIGSAAIALVVRTQAMWSFHVVVDLVLASYDLLLLRWKQQTVGARRQVRREVPAQSDWAYATAPAQGDY